VAEKTDLAAQRPDLVARAAGLMQSVRVDHAHWKLSAVAPQKQR
jgi:hypothetical protein